MPQGSSLGPSLFSVYINPLCQLRPKDAELLMFADDTAIIFRGKSWDQVSTTAELGLSMVTEWLDKHLLTLNATKTKYVCFHKTKASQPKKDLNIKIHSYPCNNGDKMEGDTCGCTTLERVNTIRYLGVFLDEKLNWQPHITVVSGRTRKLIHIFRNLRLVSDRKLIINTYKALCECIISYCICAWGGAAKSHFIEIERAQRCALKVLFRYKYQHPTSLLYSELSLLSVRKLYILRILLRYHKYAIPDLSKHKRRLKLCYIPFCRTKFAQRQFKYTAPTLYNNILKIKDTRNYTKFELKRFIVDWLALLDYNSTEELFNK